VKQYYDARALEYDEWYLGRGRFEGLARPDWDEAVQTLQGVLARLSPAKTLDVACGTGFLTQHLPGEITALDHSERMLALARGRVPRATLIKGDALALPFEDGAFERVFTAHFYGHLQAAERAAFLSEARRLAPELVVVDSTVRPNHAPAEWQTRALNDGSRFSVYKRYFEAERLAEELGGGVVLHESPWFVAVAAQRTQPRY
jgi:demethylmenaquinone methyltransferase/2-methoxy-6-polyprenyl-1,4-benzoquinol methylase